MLNATRNEDRLLRTTQALLETDGLDEILSKAASVLADEGHFPQVTITLYDRAYAVEKTSKAQWSRQVTLGLNQRVRKGAKSKQSLLENSFSLFLTVKGEALGEATVFLDEKGRSVPEEELNYYQAVVNIAGVAVKQVQRRTELEELSIKDELTGCYNRRYFLESLDKETSWASRYGRVFSLLLLDLDGLKIVNDVHGHLAGDAALRTFGELLRESVRTSDLVCRYGGDEFTVILPETSKSQATLLAQRLIRKVERHRLKLGRHRLRLSTCCGISAFPEDKDLVDKADQHCYQEKTAKKNANTNVEKGG